MIFGKDNYLDSYSSLRPAIVKCLETISDTDFTAMSDGKYDIDGDNIFLKLMTYQTRRRNDTPEGHEKYIDVQYMISGEEYVDYGFVDEMQEIVECHKTEDYTLYRGPTNRVKMTEGTFIVLYPEDVHACCISVNRTVSVRKAVFKIKI